MRTFTTVLSIKFPHFLRDRIVEVQGDLIVMTFKLLDEN